MKFASRPNDNDMYLLVTRREAIGRWHDVEESARKKLRFMFQYAVALERTLYAAGEPMFSSGRHRWPEWAGHVGSEDWTRWSTLED